MSLTFSQKVHQFYLNIKTQQQSAVQSPKSSVQCPLMTKLRSLKSPSISLSLTISQKVQTRQSKVVSPKSSVQSPQSKVLSLKSSVQSPQSKVLSPKSLVQIPQFKVPKTVTNTAMNSVINPIMKPGILIASMDHFWSCLWLATTTKAEMIRPNRGWKRRVDYDILGASLLHLSLGPMFPKIR